MKIFPYDNTKGFNLDQYNSFVNHVRDLMPGKWEMATRKPQRTPKQNSTIHAIFPDLATELNGLGIQMSFGKFKASFTEITAKEFFVEIYLAGKRTSKCNTKELADGLTNCIEDINSVGGQLAVKNGPWRILQQELNQKQKC